MFKPDIKKIKEMIVSVAEEELLPYFEKTDYQHKSDGSIVTEIDITVQQRIENYLTNNYPDSIVLGEEMSIQEQEHAFNGNQSIWCLDPIDGTSNFAFGIPYFAISLALIQNKEVVFGLVYDPIRKECFSAYDSKAYIDNTIIQPNTKYLELNKAMAIIDFKRLPSSLATNLVDKPPYASQRNFGASALDWCWLATGRGHVYIHGSQNIWDYAAGHFIFENCGGISKTLNEENIFKCRLEKRSVIAAANNALFKQWNTWIKSNK